MTMNKLTEELLIKLKQVADEIFEDEEIEIPEVEVVVNKETGKVTVKVPDILTEKICARCSESFMVYSQWANVTALCQRCDYELHFCSK